MIANESRGERRRERLACERLRRQTGAHLGQERERDVLEQRIAMTERAYDGRAIEIDLEILRDGAHEARRELDRDDRARAVPLDATRLSSGGHDHVASTAWRVPGSAVAPIPEAMWSADMDVHAMRRFHVASVFARGCGDEAHDGAFEDALHVELDASRGLVVA